MSRLAEKRKLSGLTLSSIAYEARVSRGTAEKVEKDVPIRREYAQRIVDALNRLSNSSYTIQDLEIVTT